MTIIKVDYEAVAASRPRLRRDVLFVQTPTGVLFHNADGGFSVNAASAYRFVSLIAPYLDGARTVAALCQGFGAGQRAMMAQLVGALYENGFARDVAGTAPDARGGLAALDPAVTAQFAAQIAYVDHYAEDGGGGFTGFRNSRVAVLGTDLQAAWSVLSLVRNGCSEIGVLRCTDAESGRFAQARQEARALAAAGCAVSIRLLDLEPNDGRRSSNRHPLDDYDVLLITGGPTGHRTMAQLLARGIPAGQLVLPSWSLGTRAVIGPLTRPGTAGCWLCAVLRLEANGHDTSRIWRAIAPQAPLELAEPAVSAPMAAMLGNLLAFETFRFITGCLVPDTERRIIVQDLESLDAVSERLYPHPRCPYCARLATNDPRQNDLARDLTEPDLTEPGAAEPGAAEPDLTGTGVAASPAAALDEQRRATALAELETRNVLFGRHAGVFRDYDDEGWEQVPLKVGTVTVGTPAGPRRITAFDLHHTAAARLRAVRRAAEVYADHVVPAASKVADAQSPSESDRQHADSPAAQRLLTASGAAGEQHSSPGTQVPVTSMRTGTVLWIPAAAVRPFSCHNAGLAYEATSAGVGAGESAGAAAERGLLKALTYEALLDTMHERLSTSVIALKGLAEDPELDFLVRTADNLGIDMELLQLGDAATRPVPTLLARYQDRSDQSWQWAAGSAPRWRDAAVAACRDLLGRRQLSGPVSTAAGAAAIDTGDPLLPDFEAGTLSPQKVETADLASEAGAGSAAKLLMARGRDAFVAAIRAPDLLDGGVHVARVLLPAET